MGGGPFHPLTNGASQAYTIHAEKISDDELYGESALFMDPVSLAASIITVITLAGSTAKELTRLCRALRDAPAEVHALHNEIVDLQGILHAIQAVADAENGEEGVQKEAKPDLQKGSPKAPAAMMIVHLDRAKEKLSELCRLIQKCMAKGNFFQFHSIWLKERSKARSLQRELHNIRTNLQTALLVVNSSRSARVELIVHEVLLGQQHLSNDLVQSFQAMASQYQSLDGQVNGAIPRLSHEVQRASSSDLSSPSPDSPQTPSTALKTDTVVIRTSCADSGNRSCKKWCSCVCHKQNHLKLCAPLNYVLGSLFVGYSGLPVSTPPCNEHSCVRRAIPSMELSYYFPRWFLARSFLMSLKVVPLAGPELILRMPRLIRWTTPEANLFHLARAGSIKGIQSMLNSGTVSPFDVTLSSGESALFFAASSGKWETCKFLLEAGADAQLANKHQLKPIECAWQWILNGRLDAAAASTVQAMFGDASFLETRQFSVIHKVVLGLLSFKNLEVELQASTSTINDVDAGGRSALSWAAERADTRALQLLLAHRAETNSPDNSGAHPLHYAAIAKDTASLQTLLEHGAEVDCCDAHGRTPLQWASQTLHDPTFLLPLISAGAVVNAGDYEGETALMYAARNERVRIAAYLLRSGADVNGHTIWGLTALDLCVRYNCHQMLNFLLQHGSDYKSRDNLGQTILHQAAKDGDAQTIAALIDMGLPGLSRDQKDSSGKAAWDYLEDRADGEITELFNALRE